MPSSDILFLGAAGVWGMTALAAQRASGKEEQESDVVAVLRFERLAARALAPRHQLPAFAAVSTWLLRQSGKGLEQPVVDRQAGSHRIQSLRAQETNPTQASGSRRGRAAAFSSGSTA
jgi:hypothetical protein